MLDGLVREFEAAADEWRYAASVANETGQVAAMQLATVRAETWEAATRMARKWGAALAEEKSD